MLSALSADTLIGKKAHDNIIHIEKIVFKKCFFRIKKLLRANTFPEVIFMPKTAIIGAGRVGSSLAYTLAVSGMGGSICIIDVDEALARDDVPDLTKKLIRSAISANEPLTRRDFEASAKYAPQSLYCL